MKRVPLSQVGNYQLFYLFDRKNARAYVKSVFELKNSGVLVYSNGSYDIISPEQVVYIK